jgi:hypothetical protein
MDITNKTRIEKALCENDRKSSRFTIPGATISLSQIPSGCSGSPAGSAGLPLADISLGGVSFLTNMPPKLGRISLFLTPGEGEAPLRLEGKVVYFAYCGKGLDYQYRVGVKLARFAGGRGCNAPETLVRLERLETIHNVKDLSAESFLTGS